MKAWRVHTWGEPEQMSFDDVPLPDPGPGEVRIRHHAASLNFFEILQIQGKYQVRPPLPFTPGAEAAGVVDAVGEGVTGVGSGQPVFALLNLGSYAEFSIAKAERVWPIPDGMDFAEAAAVPLAYHTSYFALRDRGQLRPGEWLLVHAGASGVGMAAIQLGKALGAQIIATAGSDDKLAFCRAQGAAHALDYRGGSWVDQVKEITGGRGADVIYDPVGGEVFDLSTKCIAPEGRILIVGFASGRIPSIALNRVLLKDISIVGVHWGGYVDPHPDFLQQTHQALMALHREGRIRPAVSQRYPLRDAPRALRDMAERRVIGRAVLAM